jgi:hypothetical protein
MKKFYFKTLAMVMAMVLLNAQTFAVGMPLFASSSSDDAATVVNFDENEVYAEFSEIESITTLLTETDASFDELALEVTALDMVSAVTSLPVLPSGDTAPPLGIPSFLWGCVFGIFGLALVYFMTGQDSEQTRKALWGCVLGTLIWGFGGFAFY